MTDDDIDTNNVVYLKSDSFTEVAGNTIRKPNSRSEYLKVCRRFLDDFMYEELLCSILDREYFDASNEQIQNIVESYYSYPL